MICAALAALAVVLSPIGGAASSAQEERRAPGGAKLKRIGNFDSPVYVTGAPGFGDRVFIVEQAGQIRIVRDGRKLGSPFLDIGGLVQFGGERGLLSVAFPPDYKQSRLFYVFYTDSQGDLVVDEFKRRSPTQAARGSRRNVIQIPHRTNSNHNGGQLQFLGQNLYISTGDGGSGGDPPDNAKNKSRLLGKILRIDPRNPKGKARFSIPRSNPFVGRDGADEVFSYGLRNPFRFSFDRVTASAPRIVIGDVGQERFEEIDYETVSKANGAFFGWDEFEGYAAYECDGACAKQTEKPIYAYGRGGGACSVIGGYVVRDRALKALRGRYVFADLCEGEIRSLQPGLKRVRSAPPIGISISTPTSFGEDTRGRLYVTSLDGPVYRLVPR